MLITLHSANTSLTVDTLGAQMMSLRSGETEYLWQGDPQYWQDRAPILFPFIGRLTDNRYRFHGKEYHMGIHGFAANMEFAVAQRDANSLTLSLGSSPETKRQYPFDFSFRVTYCLEGDTVTISFVVQNRGEERMPFGIGGHPGFRVPLEEGETFSDYYLEFSQPCQPARVGFTPAVYLSGQDSAYALEDGRRIRLRHDLFDEDAIILKNMDRQITLRSAISGRGVTVTCPQMPYLGIWHMPKTDAPYVCIEPWSSLPARQDVVEEFSCKSGLIPLEPGDTHRNTWTICMTPAGDL
ncbi:MAG: aldose 1-epimerase family protein [Faecousia sp.]